MQKTKKILVIRFHAFGDVAITFPYVNGLHTAFPDAKIDFLTAKRVEVIPLQIQIFNRVIGVRGSMNNYLLLFWTILQIPSLLFRSYDIIVDLQNDRKSKLVQFFLKLKIRNTFEKFAPIFSGQRYQNAISELGIKSSPNFNIKLQQPELGREKLEQQGWKSGEKLIVLNPAGFYSSRNWPIENYLALIELLQKKLTTPFKIVLIGEDRILEKSTLISAAFPNQTINLVNQTTQLEAFALLAKMDVVLTEDSGLGHMAWVQGVKTLFLFGSTRADWTAPPYPHVVNLTSSDLDCGDCMQAICKWGDVRCLSRYSAAFIADTLVSLLDKRIQDRV